MGEVHAAIDIGTNSIHLVVARVGDEGGLEILTREKENTRLGSGSGDMRRLDDAAIDRGISALERFRLVAETFDADISAVATSAVREAANRDVFIRRAAAEAGITLRALRPREASLEEIFLRMTGGSSGDNGRPVDTASESGEGESHTSTADQREKPQVAS